jgi:hypothetical protein
VSNIHYLEDDASPTAECPGTNLDPQAAAGNICIYTDVDFGSVSFDTIDLGYPRSAAAGATVLFIADSNSGASGTFAVTAP